MPRTNTPFCHLELLSVKGEERLGAKSFVLILKDTYKTDGTDEIIKANLTHSAQVMNKTVPINRTAFPYVALVEDTGFGGVNRDDAWVYLSQRNLLTQTQEIKDWILQLATEYHSHGMRVDSSQNPATIFKIVWDSTELSPK